MTTPSRFRMLALVAALVAASCNNRSNTVSPIQVIPGSGVIAEQNRAVRGFSEVVFATVGSLMVEQGAAEALRIRAEDNLLPYLVTEVQNGVLVARTASGVDLEETLPVEFFLTVVDLDRFEFAGVGAVEMSTLVVDQLTLVSSGIGPVLLSDFDAIGLDVTLSGLGEVSVFGQVDDQVIRSSGFGSYESSGLSSRQATVTLTAFGSATVSVSDRLVVTISGSGSVYYIGNPVVQSTITGSGRVEKIG